nr:putative atp-dependent helicase irc20 [Quercus suber]
MARIDRHEPAMVLSTCVMSNDEHSVLVEPGSFTPVRYFCERLVNATRKDAGEPPTKRRRLIDEQPADFTADRDGDEHIVISRITIDLCFPGTLHDQGLELNKTPLDERLLNEEVIEVALLRFDHEEDDTASVNKHRLALTHPDQKGPILTINLGGVTPSLVEDLWRFIGSPVRANRPATFTRSTLARSSEQSSTVRFQVSLCWRSGVSAFPAGFPVGSARIYEDYDVLVQHFPDSRRERIDQNHGWSPQDFYDSVHVPSQDNDWNDHFGEILKVALYPFQMRAVVWMMRREGVVYNRGQISCLSDQERLAEQPSFFTEYQDIIGQPCFVNHLQGIVSRRPPDTIEPLSGGILAEEMGLGKTVELMALIILHPKPQPPVTGARCISPKSDARLSKATLIISPSSILEQWKSELSRHAPLLRVFHYEGVSGGGKKARKEADIIEDLTRNFDVVLTTYQTLRKEVHFAEDPPERNMRHSRRFERKRSPLVQITWWRVVLDEAQMVESGVSAAARVARQLPRVHNWAVSGTPLKKDVADLHGLLLFLRYHPFCESSALWGHLITNHRHFFHQVFAKIALRHTKAQVRSELHIPSQKRVVITMPFSAVEQQHYTSLFKDMCEQVGVDNDGSPTHDQWDPESPVTIEAMRTWLTRLRQTCLHPQVGVRNRKALGRGQGPLRTVAEVLEVMIEQNETHLRIEERAILASELLRAHILSNNKEDTHRAERALEIYESAMVTSETLVSEARRHLEDAKAAEPSMNVSDRDSEDEDASSDPANRLGKLRLNLRSALQLQHVCCFFTATSYFQIKDNPLLTTPDTDRFKELEEREVALYESAKVLRREILKDTARKAEKLMMEIRALQTSGSPMIMPPIKYLSWSGGIENRKIVDKSRALFNLIAEQSKLISEWSARMAEYLVKYLVDEDEGKETTGEEYEESTKQQDELYVYFDVLKTLRADLNTCVTGESAPLMDHEAKGLVREARGFLDAETEYTGVIHAPELLLELMSKRNALKNNVQAVGSIRGLIQEARAMENSMEWQGGTRQDSERHLVRQHLGALQKTFAAYTKALSHSEKVMDLFRSTQNQRLEFYRQLQELSDAVAPHKDQLDEQLDLESLQAATLKSNSQSATLQALKTRNRFLLHLRENSTPEDCVICRCPISTGVITVCAHQYCKECITHWWQQHRTCPVCKRRLALADFHDITYKPKDIRAQEEVQSPNKTQDGNKALLNDKTIYSGIDPKLLDEVKAIDLPSSYGTKIDTLGRHLHWIREHDPGAKSIVFSQYREFLDVLGTALSSFKLGHSRLGRASAVEKFCSDPSIDCLLLDAKTDSSGLTLVAATHVFICEPLIQTAVELQAIARVHRIGQTRATTVWMYLVNDTVEEAIYEISVTRRLAHVQSRQQEQDGEDKFRATTPGLPEDVLDVANSAELQSAPLAKLLVAGKGDGEMVGKDDLWKCLFKKVGSSNSTALQAQVRGHLAAQSAEQRRAEGPTDSIASGSICSYLSAIGCRRMYCAVEKFCSDPSIDCLLLDAKTDSSGLTLVAATHVFICEPLIQTAVELQAIARVHRIGQTRATTVWMYLVNDTVEEAIYEISVTRRLAHVQSRQQEQDGEDKFRATTPGLPEDVLDVANSAELQSAPLAKLLVAGKGDGEMVGKDDLWKCLFKKVGSSNSTALQAQVRGHLAAQSAEQRRAEGPTDV